MGLQDDAFADAMQQTESQDVCAIFAENWESVLVFLACSSCWRKTMIVSPMGGGSMIYEGLIRSDVQIEIEMQGYTGKRAREIYSDVVHIMEPEALKHLNKVT